MNTRFLGNLIVAFSLWAGFPWAVDAMTLSHSQQYSKKSNQTNKLEGQTNEEIAPKLIGNLRLRYEGVDDDSSPLNANALTLRYRGTFETHIARKTTFLAEVEAVAKLVNDFNDGSGNQPERPIVPDPDGIELNRLQILTEIIPQTRITVGRQRIVFDDERFVGLLAFRQNDQTFDAIRASSELPGNIFIDTAYIRRTNRILGNDNPNGEFVGNSYLVNLNVPSPIGRVGGFYYSLDLTTGPDFAPNDHFSSETGGIRLIGRRHWDKLGLVWEASWARQSAIADNPNIYTADYWLGSVSVIVNDLTFNFRSEILGSDTNASDQMIRSFQTPLGTLHKFQGDADIFLVTPSQGLVDLAPSLEWRIGNLGSFSGIKGFVRYHWFSAEDDSTAYGQELNIGLTAKYKRNRFSVSYADYQAESFATDTQKLFISIVHAF